jgi:predicted Ser/Thr protein kinase
MGNKTDAALYFVREGRIKLVLKDGGEQIICAGGYFGQEQLLADTELSCRPDCSVSTAVTAEYTAVAVEKTVLGILTLDACRDVLDTSFLSISKNTENDETLGESFFSLDYSERLTTNAELEDLERHQCLGDGNFGEVWLVRSKVDLEGLDLALKIQDKSEHFAAIEAEVKIMEDLHHPFVVNLVKYYEDTKNGYILMPALPGGELFDIIYQEDGDGEVISGLAEPQGKFYAGVIADALAYLHRKNIVYRDLKPENVLIGADGYPILIDFGLGKLDSSLG